jgi:transposase
MFEGLSSEDPDNKTLSIDATYLKAHRTASSLGLKKGGQNTKLHAVTDTSGRPIRLIITAGQVSDYTGAAALLENLPQARWLLADRGYDADWFRKALADRGTQPCIPGRKSRKKTVKYPSRDIAVQCTAGNGQAPLQKTQPYRANVRQT